MSSGKHRKPKLPFDKIERGFCRFCGEPVQKPAFHWHKNCSEVWEVLNSPYRLRVEVFKRDRGTCAECGTPHLRHGNWEADHIVPLIEAKGDLAYWHLDNIQTLCRFPCHEAKTASENSARAAQRLVGRARSVSSDDHSA